MTVRVRYVDGSFAEGAPAAWPSWRGEGVDRVEVDDDSGRVVLANASLYWLYDEHGAVVVGFGSVRYDRNPVTEIVFGDSQTERARPFMPDLLLSQVKLGWWWPGTVDRPV